MIEKSSFNTAVTKSPLASIDRIAGNKIRSGSQLEDIDIDVEQAFRGLGLEMESAANEMRAPGATDECVCISGVGAGCGCFIGACTLMVATGLGAVIGAIIGAADENVTPGHGATQGAIWGAVAGTGMGLLVASCVTCCAAGFGTLFGSDSF